MAEKDDYDDVYEDPYADLRFLYSEPAGPYPWQREYWRFDMWNWVDWTVHAAILAGLGGIAAAVWWLL